MKIISYTERVKHLIEEILKETPAIKNDYRPILVNILELKYLILDTEFVSISNFLKERLLDFFKNCTITKDYFEPKQFSEFQTHLKILKRYELN